MKNKWTGGQLLALSGLDGKTDFDKGLVLRTSFTDIGIDIKLPEKAHIHFSDEPPTRSLLTGDCFKLNCNGNKIKGILPDAYHLLIDGKCRIETDPEFFIVKSYGGKTLIGVKNFFSPDILNTDIDSLIADRIAWFEKLKTPRNSDDSTLSAFHKAASILKTQIMTPQGNITKRWTTPDRWPHRGMWLWDSVFHAIGIRHIDPELAKDAIDAVLDMQQPDGFIPHQMTPHGVSNITQPPILAFGVKMVREYLNDKDNEWLKTIYDKLKSYLEWDIQNREIGGTGLPGWARGETKTCRSGESGMDNSPRFDNVELLLAVDFASYLAMEYGIMSQFAAILKKEEDILLFNDRHKKLCNLINKFFWDDKTGFYLDYDLQRQCRLNLPASSGFLPLLCGAANSKQAAALASHLENPRTFKAAFPIPSVPLSSELYSPDMWRGPTWININWLIAYGFKQYGFKKYADRIVKRTIKEITDMYNIYGTFFEFYDAASEIHPPKLLRKGKNAPEKSHFHQVIFDYGWTATLFIDMLYDMIRPGQ